MAKGKPRWERVSAYELAKKKALGQASEREVEAANEASALRRGGSRPQVFNAGGRLVVR